MKNIIIVLTLFLIIFKIEAQNYCTDYNYKVDEDRLEFIVEKINKNSSVFLKSKEFKKNKISVRKEYSEIIESTEKYTKRHFSKNFLVFEDEINNYFNRILDKIFTDNTFLDRNDYHIFLSRQNYPNAATYLNGYIIINADLISKFKNEGDFAMVICHEIAHNYFKHGKNKVLDNINILHSDSIQKKLKILEKQEYNTYKDAEKLSDLYRLDSKKHSRYKEYQADSMAYELLKNTIYSEKNAVTSLEQLDSCDKQKFNKKINFIKEFSSKFITLSETHFEKEVVELSLFGKASLKIDRDSLEMIKYHTHPECKKRVQKIKEFIKNDKTPITNTVGTKEEYKNFKRAIDKVLLESNYFWGDYTQGIFFNLQYIKKFPEDNYAKAFLAMKFYNLSILKNDHRLGKVLDIQTYDKNKQLIRLNTLLNNLESEDFLNISKGLINLEADNPKSCEYHLYSNAYLNKKFNNIEVFLKYKEEYIKDYPEGKYIKIINKLN